MSGVDRLDVTRHWLIAGPHGGPMLVFTEGDAQYWRDHSKLTVTGPFVLEAEQPEGAVGALERIADLDEEYGEETAAGEIALGALVDLGVRPRSVGGQ